MISLLLPTRKRPERLADTLGSILNTTENLTAVEVLVYIADDDDSYDALMTAAAIDRSRDVGYFDVKFVRGPRVIMSDLWNVLLPHARGDIVMLCADDVMFRTRGWDVAVEAAFFAVPDKILLAFADDGSPNGKQFATLPFVHRRWFETLGYFTGPGFSADYSDTWPQDIADMLQRKVLVDGVLIEHLHWIWGKAEKDQTYVENQERLTRDNCAALYKRRLPERLADATKLRAVMGTPWLTGDEDDEPVKPVKWSLLVLTQPSRIDFLRRLLYVLQQQLAKHPEVELRVRTFDESLDLGANRQKLIDAARGEYLNFIDDDDLVPADYIDRILPLLHDVDQVGFRVQCYEDGQADKRVAIHSLKFKSWSEDRAGLYRDISHINPIRTSIARTVAMSGGPGEDHRWAAELRATGLIKTEAFVDDVMYHYYFRSQKDAETKRPTVAATKGNCPNCHSRAIPASYPGGVRRCMACNTTFHV